MSKPTRKKETTVDSRLFESIGQAAKVRGMKMTEVAELMGMSPSYLMALNKGHEKTSKLSRKYIDEIAEFIDQPVITVMLMAGVIKVEDFFVQSKNRFEHELDQAVGYILKDPEWGVLLDQHEELSSQVKLIVVTAYERATGKRLVQSAMNKTTK